MTASVKISGIVAPSDVEMLADDELRQLCGGKGLGLVRMTQAGLNVPPFVIFTSKGLEELYEKHWGTSINADVEKACLSSRIMALGGDLSELIGGRFSAHPRAVRSSAASEDGALSSAGQLDSFLNVEIENIEEAVLKVFASAYGEKARTYARVHGFAPQVPAVIVQNMVDAQFAGVVFSLHPVSGEKRPVIATVSGLADKLVSGAEDGKTVFLDDCGDINEMQKDYLKLALGQCEELFSGPQDIEFACAQGKIFLVQCRQLTAFAQSSGSSDKTVRIFDGSNIQESYPGITGPLTYSFIASAYGEVYKSFVRIMGVDERVIEKNADIFGSMLGYVEGHVFYNLASWYRLLAMLPAYKTNRPFMEGMMGLKDSAASRLGAEADCKTAAFSEWGAWWATIASVICIVKNYLTMETQIKDFNERLKVLDFEVDGLGLSELAARYRLLQKELLSHWQAPVCNDFFAMIFTGLLSRCVKDPQRYLRSGNVISSLPPRLIAELAGLVAKSDNMELIEALTSKDTARALCLLERERDCWIKYQEYVALFADRTISELKLESPSVASDPSLLLATIGALAGSKIGAEKTAPIADTAAVHNRLEKHENASARGNAFLTGWLAGKARLCLKRRENLRFERTRVFGAVRRIFLAIGALMVRDCVLDDERDIFYLTVDEVLGFIDGASVCINPRALAALRKASCAEFVTDCPERITAHGAVGLHHFESDRTVASAIGASPGIIRGLARVILDPEKESCLPGEIIVADHTDPGWIVHFASCSGIVVAHGSILSHTAIVAREMGIPAVVGMRSALNEIKTGDYIEINGSQGTVAVLNRSADKLDERPAALSEGTTNLDGSIIRYSQCWEDADLLTDCMEVHDGDSILCIASAGDNTFSLLSRSPGRVVAVDFCGAQMALVALKAAAFKSLEYGELLEFLGARPSRRRAELFKKILDSGSLKPEYASFFTSPRGQKAVAGGVINCGKLDRYFSLFRKFLLPLVHSKETVEALFESRSAVQRKVFYENVWKSPAYVLAFGLFFNSITMSLLGREKEFFKQSGGSLLAFLKDASRAALVEADPSKNCYLQYILTGEYRVLPHYLRLENYQAIRDNLDKLSLVQGELEQLLGTMEDGSIDCFNLSDVFEYLPADRACALTTLIREKARPGARLIYWNMMVERQAWQYDGQVQNVYSLSKELPLYSQTFFYRLFAKDIIRETANV